MQAASPSPPLGGEQETGEPPDPGVCFRPMCMTRGESECAISAAEIWTFARSTPSGEYCPLPKKHNGDIGVGMGDIAVSSLESKGSASKLTKDMSPSSVTPVTPLTGQDSPPLRREGSSPQRGRSTQTGEGRGYESDDESPSPPRCPRGKVDSQTLSQGFKSGMSYSQAARKHHSTAGQMPRTLSIGSCSSVDSSPTGQKQVVTPRRRGVQRRVHFSGDVQYVDPEAGPHARPPNVMRLMGVEWDYDKLVAAMRGCTDGGKRIPLPLKTRMHHLKSFHHSFKGDHLVEWLLKNTPASNRTEAVELARDLVANRVVERCDHLSRSFDVHNGDNLYRLWEDSRHVTGHTPHANVLNARKAWVGDARDPGEICEDLLLTLSECFTEVEQDYRALSACPKFASFVERAAELQHTNLSSLASEPDREAFWVNLYNILALHALVSVSRCGEPAKSRTREHFFEKLYYDVGGNLFSLNDIEQGIIFGKRFSKGDSRAGWRLSHPVKALSIALQHITPDSLPVQVYASNGLETQVRDACSEVLAKARIEKDTLHLPAAAAPVVKFGGGDKELLEFIRPFLPAPVQAAVRAAKKVKLAVKPGEWEPPRYLVRPV
eukprot:Hpha_TRINITY_DN16009_c0_g1::TRINITY_DN16009_c0_g1_i2::g.122129::m.122129